VAQAPLEERKYFEFPGWELYDGAGRKLTATRLTQMANQRKKRFDGTAVPTIKLQPFTKQGKSEPTVMKITYPQRKLTEIVSLVWKNWEGTWQRTDNHPIPFVKLKNKLISFFIKFASTLT